MRVARSERTTFPVRSEAIEMSVLSDVRTPAPFVLARFEYRCLDSIGPLGRFGYRPLPRWFPEVPEMKERERERGGERESDKERERDRDRQTETETDKERERDRDRQTETDRGRGRGRGRGRERKWENGIKE